MKEKRGDLWAPPGTRSERVVAPVVDDLEKVAAPAKPVLASSAERPGFFRGARIRK